MNTPVQTSELILNSAIAGLEAIESGRRSLDDFLDFDLRQSEVRRTVSDLLFGYFRRKKQLDALISLSASRPPQPKVRRLLAVALAQIFLQTAIAPESAVNIAVCVAKKLHGVGSGNFVNAILRNALRRNFVMTDDFRHVLPDSPLMRWQKRFPDDEMQSLADCLLARPEFTFRAVRDYVPTALNAQSIPAFGEFRFYRAENAGELIRSPDFAAGRIYIQDPATSLSVSLIEDWSLIHNVLDACGAPGGKALMIAERLAPGAMLTVNDASEARQRSTRENFQRFHLDYPITVGELAQIKTNFDLIFLDVPCSNSGVFRRRPDALWRFSAAHLHLIVKKQLELLEQAATKVVPGGRLLYSTCSMEEEENSRQIADFLSRHPEFSLVRERQILPTLQSDGAYAALLKKS